MLRARPAPHVTSLTARSMSGTLQGHAHGSAKRNSACTDHGDEPRVDGATRSSGLQQLAVGAAQTQRVVSASQEQRNTTAGRSGSLAAPCASDRDSVACELQVPSMRHHVAPIVVSSTCGGGSGKQHQHHARATTNLPHNDVHQSAEGIKKPGRIKDECGRLPCQWLLEAAASPASSMPLQSRSLQPGALVAQRSQQAGEHRHARPCATLSSASGSVTTKGPRLHLCVNTQQRHMHGKVLQLPEASTGELHSSSSSVGSYMHPRSVSRGVSRVTTPSARSSSSSNLASLDVPVTSTPSAGHLASARVCGSICTADSSSSASLSGASSTCSASGEQSEVPTEDEAASSSMAR